jgi:hypothetical protein
MRLCRPECEEEQMPARDTVEGGAKQPGDHRVDDVVHNNENTLTRIGW